MKQQSVLQKDLLVIISGLFGGLATIGLILFFNKAIEIVWDDFLGVDTSYPSRNFYAPLAIIITGLIVGLIAKYFGSAMGGLEDIVEKISQKGSIPWRDVPRTLTIGLISVCSGASLGPEAPSTVASAGASSWLGEKSGSNLKVKKMMGWSSLLGMVAGFFILVSHSSHGSFGVPGTIPALPNLPLGFLFGIAGALAAILIGIVMYLVEPVFLKFDKKPLEKALLGSAVVAVLVFIAPLTMFSGQYVLPDLVSSATSMSFIALIGLALVKLLSTNILIRCGFFGGPIFPALFAGSAVGLALSYLLIGTANVAIIAALAGLLTITLKKPAVAGLLSVAFGGTIAVPSVLLGVAGGMLVEAVIRKTMIKSIL